MTTNTKVNQLRCYVMDVDVKKRTIFVKNAPVGTDVSKLRAAFKDANTRLRDNVIEMTMDQVSARIEMLKKHPDQSVGVRESIAALETAQSRVNNPLGTKMGASYPSPLTKRNN